MLVNTWLKVDNGAISKQVLLDVRDFARTIQNPQTTKTLALDVINSTEEKVSPLLQRLNNRESDLMSFSSYITHRMSSDTL